MRLDIASRRAKRREAALKRRIESDNRSDSKRSDYQPSTESLIDCKGECGKVISPFRNDGYCSDCKGGSDHDNERASVKTDAPKNF